MNQNHRSAVKIVAELSANHNGDLEVALETIRAFHEAGADAIKLQTYSADSLTIDCQRPEFRIDQGTLWDGKSYYELYSEAAMPMEWHETLFRTCSERGLEVFTTPFSLKDVEFLDRFSLSQYKIASFEITDTALIRAVASRANAMVLSTGIARIDEIFRAVEICRDEGVDEVTLLHCVSSYPADPRDINLRTMCNLEQTFGVKVGLSDHTIGPEIALAATALGATMIEKHVILDRSLGGPDSSFSIEPAEFSEMVRMVRNIEAGLGSVEYAMTSKKQNNRRFSRSLYVVEDANAGDTISSENVRSIRPGYGMEPRYLDTVIGRRFRTNTSRGTPLDWNLVD